MNSKRIRIIRLPGGERALEYRVGTDLEQLRWVRDVLGMDLSLVVSDEGPGWMTYLKWRLRQPVWTPEERETCLRQLQAEAAAKLRSSQR